MKLHLRNPRDQPPNSQSPTLYPRPSHCIFMFIRSKSQFEEKIHVALPTSPKPVVKPTFPRTLGQHWSFSCLQPTSLLNWAPSIKRWPAVLYPPPRPGPIHPVQTPTYSPWLAMSTRPPKCSPQQAIYRLHYVYIRVNHPIPLVVSRSAADVNIARSLLQWSGVSGSRTIASSVETTGCKV